MNNKSELVKSYIEYNNKRSAIKGDSKRKYDKIGLGIIALMFATVVGIMVFSNLPEISREVTGRIVNVWALVFITTILGYTTYVEKVVDKRDEEEINRGVSDSEKVFYDQIDAMGTSSRVYALNEMYEGEGLIVDIGNFYSIESVGGVLMEQGEVE